MTKKLPAILLHLTQFFGLKPKCEHEITEKLDKSYTGRRYSTEDDTAFFTSSYDLNI
jgi:hypothetical protein